MVKITCSESGIEFEAATARTKQHPKIASLKAEANKRGTYREVNEALLAIRQAGGYTTIDQYIQLVHERIAAAAKVIAEREAKFSAQRKAEDEAAKQRKAKRDEQNAFLRANGYHWQHEYEDDEYGEDPSSPWVLVAPDRRIVTVDQALEEIQRGMEVVKAERAEAKAKAQQAEAQRIETDRKQCAEVKRFAEHIQANNVEVEIDYSRRNWTVIAKSSRIVIRSTVVNCVPLFEVARISFGGDEYPRYYCADARHAGLQLAEAEAENSRLVEAFNLL